MIISLCVGLSLILQIQLVLCGEKYLLVEIEGKMNENVVDLIPTLSPKEYRTGGRKNTEKPKLPELKVVGKLYDVPTWLLISN